MKYLKLACILVLLQVCMSESRANVYVIIYATKEGKTGHAGIAIDNYQIQVSNNKTDTVRTGTLTYFDLWPDKDRFGLFNYGVSREAKFYKLPNSIWSSPLTVASLYDKGIPHKEFYPCDAILMIPTDAKADHSMVSYLDKFIEVNKSFNARFFNCSDFVLAPIAEVLGIKMKAKEFIPLSFTTTPNKLCRKLMDYDKVQVIKSPGNIVRRSFMREKVMKRSKSKQLFS